MDRNIRPFRPKGSPHAAPTPPATRVESSQAPPTLYIVRYGPRGCKVADADWALFVPHNPSSSTGRLHILSGPNSNEVTASPASSIKGRKFKILEFDMCDKRLLGWKISLAPILDSENSVAHTAMSQRLVGFESPDGESEREEPASKLFLQGQFLLDVRPMKTTGDFSTSCKGKGIFFKEVRGCYRTQTNYEMLVGCMAPAAEWVRRVRDENCGENVQGKDSEVWVRDVGERLNSIAKDFNSRHLE